MKIKFNPFDALKRLLIILLILMPYKVRYGDVGPVFKKDYTNLYNPLSWVAIFISAFLCSLITFFQELWSNLVSFNKTAIEEYETYKQFKDTDSIVK